MNAALVALLLVAAAPAQRAQPSEVQMTSQTLAERARIARTAGRLFTAAWATERALATAPVAPLAVEEARRLGWTLPDDAPTGGDSLPSPWPWWLVGAAVWLALLAAAWALRDRTGLIALGVGLVASLIVMPDGAVERPALPDALTRPLGEGLCIDQRVYWEDGHLTVLATCGGKAARWRIDRRDSGQGAVMTAHHGLGGGGTLGGTQASRELEGRLVAAVTAAEATGYRTRGDEAWTMGRIKRWQGADSDTRAMLQVAAGVVAAALVVILLGLWSLLRAVCLGADRRLLLWFLGTFFVAVLAHLLVEGRMRMMYSGYHVTELLLHGEVPRYGPGAVWFYGPIQWLLGGDHALIQGLNRLYGLGCCGAVVALAAIWFDGRTAAVTAGLVCALPFLWFAHSCESIHVAPTLAVLVAVGLLCHPSARSPIGAALALMAAALTRPEIAAVVCLVPIWLWLLSGRPALRRPDGARVWPWLLALVAGYLLVGWRMTEVLTVSDQLMDQGAVASPGRWIERGWYAMGLGGVFMSPGYLPSVLLPVALFAAGHPRTRQVALPTVLLGLVWLGSAGVDYAYVSLIRLQLPVVFLWLPLIAAGALTLYDGRRGRPIAIGLVALLVAGSAFSAQALAHRTVEDDEDQLWRMVSEVVPYRTDGRDKLAELPPCIVTHIYGDETVTGKTPRFIPRYLMDGSVSLHPLHALEEVKATCAGTVYFLRGTRCYAQMRPYGTPPPPEGTDYCTRAPPVDQLEVVFERDVPNVSVPTYPMYPAGDTLRLGLYRLRP